MSKNAVMPLTDYVNACDALREKTGATELIKSGQLPEKINAVFEAGFKDGEKAEYNRFWDTMQNNGTRRSYTYQFYGTGWTDETFKPKYDFILASDNTRMFTNSKITDLKGLLENSGVVFDTSKANNLSYLYENSSITNSPLIDTNNLSDLTRIFYNARALREVVIRLKDDGSQTFTSLFTNCTALMHLMIQGVIGKDGFNVSPSTELTKTSLINIIDALKDFSTFNVYVQEKVQLSMYGHTPILYVSNLTEGQTLAVDLWVNDDLKLSKVEQKVHTINVNNDIGEKIGVHYSVPYWDNPDEYTFNLILYQHQIQDDPVLLGLGAVHYIQNIKTGEITDGHTEGDKYEITVYTKSATENHTVTLGATNLAKLTDAEKVQATEKGWTLL